MREIDDDEGARLLRIARHGTGSVVTWRRAQMVLLSAQGMPIAKITEVAVTSPDRVRDLIHDFNTSRDPDYAAKKPVSSTSTRSPTARSCPRTANRKSCCVLTSSGRST